MSENAQTHAPLERRGTDRRRLAFCGGRGRGARMEMEAVPVPGWTFGWRKGSESERDRRGHRSEGAEAPASRSGAGPAAEAASEAGWALRRGRWGCRGL